MSSQVVNVEWKSKNFDEDKPKSEQPKSEQPKLEQPKSEQPKSKQPKSEQSKSEQPKSEQPKSKQPKSEQPKSEKKCQDGIAGNFWISQNWWAVHFEAKSLESFHCTQF